MSDKQNRMNLFDEPEQTSLDEVLEAHKANPPELEPTAPPAAQPAAPVNCLGQSFPDEAARRAHFTERLREKLADPAFRQIEGFPLGSDEDILALSDPPYYTACPNPFIAEFIQFYGKPYDPGQTYHREPFAVDVSEGKTDPIYNAHSYHTKVPHKAIMPAILHYTEPGDLILDGFCGTGMTGVAAQLCANPEPEFKQKIEAEWEKAGLAAPRWGARRVVLNDLSPAATFISANYNLPFDVTAFAREAHRLLSELKQEIGWMYRTRHADGISEGWINYTVWSEIFSCPNCDHEIIFLKEALDRETKRVRESFPCPECQTELTKTRLRRIYENYFDPVINQSLKRNKRQPVLINYSIGKTKYEKEPDKQDLALLQQIAEKPLATGVPINEIPFMHMTHERARMAAFGITHLHHFYLQRPAQALGLLWDKTNTIKDNRVRNSVFFFVEQALWGLSLMNRFSLTHFSQTNRQLTGVYYVASQHAEVSPWYNLEGKLKRLTKTFLAINFSRDTTLQTTGTAGQIGLLDNSIDYIFTDPPFGENIYYADLNFLVESWHRVWTQAQPEAIVDHAKHKELAEYQRLMANCFLEYYRVLKPGRWMTVVFHNSRSSVWNAIQEALQQAGFVVADVRTLNKQQGSYRQVTSSTVKQDLIISAYKPNGGLEERFELERGTEAGAWDFVNTHLRQLPVFVAKGERAEPVAERMNYLLFDRMVAFHVQRGVLVPLSAAEFYAGLEQRYLKRDQMYFLSEQVVEYDRKRQSVKEIIQLQLLITGEASAIEWLRQQLHKKPQTFAEIHPQFIRELGGWQKHETSLELSTLLEENFLRYEGRGPLPAQLVSWLKLSATHRELLKAAPPEAFTSDGDWLTPDPALAQAAQERWYVPNPAKLSDLEKKREQALLKEFEVYRQGQGQSRLKVFRLEAVRAGFKKAYQEHNYKLILEVAEKLPQNVLQEDQKLIMWYDNALLRGGSGMSSTNLSPPPPSQGRKGSRRKTSPPTPAP